MTRQPAATARIWRLLVVVVVNQVVLVLVRVVQVAPGRLDTALLIRRWVVAALSRVVVVALPSCRVVVVRVW